MTEQHVEKSFIGMTLSPLCSLGLCLTCQAAAKAILSVSTSRYIQRAERDFLLVLISDLFLAQTWKDSPRENTGVPENPVLEVCGQAGTPYHALLETADSLDLPGDLYVLVAAMVMVLRDFQLPTPGTISVSEDWEDPSDDCDEKKTVLLNCTWDKLVAVISSDTIYVTDARGPAIQHFTWSPTQSWSNLAELLATL